MKNNVTRWRNGLMATAALAAIVSASQVSAQSTEQAKASDILVNGKRTRPVRPVDQPTKNRANTVNPTLTYDLTEFQPFESQSIGEAVKRVPGVSFSDNPGVYDSASVGGLSTAYTQYQINGQLVSGYSTKRKLNLSDIPPELVAGIEVIRSPTADEPSEGIGGTLNIKLKRAGEFVGGWASANTTFTDGKVKPNASIGYGKAGPVSFLVSGDIATRHVPRSGNVSNFNAAGTPTSYTEYDAPTRFVSYNVDADLLSTIAGGEFRLSTFFAYDKVPSTQTTRSYNPVTRALNQVSVSDNKTDRPYFHVLGEYLRPIGQDKLQLLAAYDQTINREFITSYATPTGAPPPVPNTTATRSMKREYYGTIAYTANFTPALSLKVGADLRRSKRYIKEVRTDAKGPLPLGPNSLFDATEDMVNPYVAGTWRPTDRVNLNAGVRYERTTRQLAQFGLPTSHASSGQVNPSAHLSYQVTDAAKLRVSVARTVRNVELSLFAPIISEASPDPLYATIGNPNLKAETAWGIDAGLEYKVGVSGVFGIDYFRRDLSNLIDVVDTGTLSPQKRTLLRQENVGNGYAWGIVADLSTGLEFVGLDNTSISTNYSWLKSERVSFLTGARDRFSNQPAYILNLGLTQKLPSWGVTVGAAYNQRGSAITNIVSKRTVLDYGPNLDAFFEKRFGANLTFRLSGSNLLDATRVLGGTLFDKTGAVSGYSTENITQNGRVFTVTLRGTF